MASTSLEEISTSLTWSTQKQAVCRSTLAAVGFSAGAFQLQVTEQMTEVPWKIDSAVRLVSGGEAMRVIGRDSVGSVICRPLNDDGHQSIYVPPSLLVAADVEPA